MKRPRPPKASAPLRAAPEPRTPPVARSAAPPARRIGVACLLGVVCFLVYLSNLRPMSAWDSIPARLLPFSILREGNFDLDEFPWLRRLSPQPYFLRRGAHDHWVSRYPIGVPVMVAPLSAPVVWWLHHANIPDDDVRFRLATVVMERVAAALIAALSVGVVFITCSMMTSLPLAVALTLVYGLGTNTWVTGSQALWQHGLAELGMAGLSLFLIAPDTRRNAVAAGACAAVAVLARPTMAVVALVALVFVWRERRGRLAAFVSLPLAGVVVLLGYNLRLIGIATGAYQRGRFFFPGGWRAVGLLLSPSRGLFVYTPAAVLALPPLLRRNPPLPRWGLYLRFGLLGYLLLYSAWPGWWGGECYGPRFLTEMFPALVVCVVPTVERLWRSPPGRGLLIALAAWGVVVQVIGVYYDDNSWNKFPVRVDRRPLRVWDWSDPQIVRAAGVGWHGSDLGGVLWQALTDPRPALLQPLPAAGLAGEITADETLPLRMPAGSHRVLNLRVTNQGTATWPAFSDYGYLQVEVVWGWRRDGAPLTGVGGFVLLPRNLGPGESAPLRARVEAPAMRGTYELELTGVQVLDIDQGSFIGASLRLPAQID